MAFQGLPESEAVYLTTLGGFFFHWICLVTFWMIEKVHHSLLIASSYIILLFYLNMPDSSFIRCLLILAFEEAMNSHSLHASSLSLITFLNFSLVPPQSSPKGRDPAYVLLLPHCYCSLTCFAVPWTSSNVSASCSGWRAHNHVQRSAQGSHWLHIVPPQRFL